MSPASYLTAPPRVAVSIVAKLASECALLASPAVTLFWLSLAVSAALVVASAVYVAVRGLETFRAIKQLGRRTGPPLARIEATTAEIDRRLSLFDEREARLAGSLARLRKSQAELNVLTSALDEAIGPARRARAAVRK
jgi:hypothetical protein